MKCNQDVDHLNFYPDFVVSVNILLGMESNLSQVQVHPATGQLVLRENHSR